MEFLFVALIERFRAAGYQGMNLGMAPLAGAGDGDTVQTGDPNHLSAGWVAFNFEGLRGYKDKWHPRWEPRYLAYRFETDLPKAAIAVARAGSYPTRAVRSPGRSGSFAGFPQRSRSLSSNCGSWRRGHGPPAARGAATPFRPGLARPDPWPGLAPGHRPLIQTRVGFVWSNLLLVLVVFPLAEWRLGSKRLPVVFLGATG